MMAEALGDDFEPAAFRLARLGRWWGRELVTPCPRREEAGTGTPREEAETGTGVGTSFIPPAKPS